MNTSITSKEARKTRADKNSIEPHRVLVTSVLWFDKLSVPALWCIFKKKKGFRNNVVIRFMECTKLGWGLFLCLRFLKIVRDNAFKAEYSMADMRSKNGESLRWEVDRISSEIAIKIAQHLYTSSILYLKIIEFISKDKFSLYIEKLIKKDIYRIIQLLCIIEWNIRKEEKSITHIILWPKYELFEELKAVWPNEKVCIEYYNQFFKRNNLIFALKLIIKNMVDFFERIFFSYLVTGPSKLPMVAVHYAEGINVERRSDLCWYQGSKIDPKFILIYFDLIKQSPSPVSNDVLRQIENIGMQWICLDKRALVNRGVRTWKPNLNEHSFYRHILLKYPMQMLNRLSTERWLFKTSKNLLKKIEYWVAFYKDFNIKVHYDISEIEDPAQSIALELVGGIFIGRQRSEHFWQAISDLGNHHRHVYFAWNNRQPWYLKLDRSRIDYIIISGFPSDSVFSKNKGKTLLLRNSLFERGVSFVVTLYDNVYNNDIHFSERMMTEFYREFLKWVIEEKDVGIIIKPKKPKYFKRLIEVKQILAQARETGRCIVLTESLGRLASDAAHPADIAVGIGISSAVIEAVIAGCKGIHYDVSGLRSHTFYKWGYEKIIFDDIDRLIEALKRYKDNPNNDPGLGDWLPYMDNVDPFCDGGGGERMGTYMRWLLESFDKGKSRDEAIQYANKIYADTWGKDKVVKVL